MWSHSSISQLPQCLHVQPVGFNRPKFSLTLSSSAVGNALFLHAARRLEDLAGLKAELAVKTGEKDVVFMSLKVQKAFFGTILFALLNSKLYFV